MNRQDSDTIAVATKQKVRTIFRLGAALGTLVLVGILSGCAGNPTIGNTVDDLITGIAGDGAIGRGLSRSMEAEVVAGNVWSIPYTIKRTPGYMFKLYSPIDDDPMEMTRAISIRKVDALRTSTLEADIYALTTEDCPNRYVAIVGTLKGLRSNLLGCISELRFSKGTASDIFATPKNPSAGQTPMAYRITNRGVYEPKLVTRWPTYPLYGNHRYVVTPKQEAPQTATTNASSDRNQQPQARAVTVSEPPKKRLPQAQKVSLPGRVEETGPKYDKPVVDLGI